MSELGERVAAGDLRALARAATLVENGGPPAEALLRELFPRTGRATLTGITGAPGSGKSTFADRLARLLRAEGKQVGIIAVDPTSAYTGGAILGDRIRMQAHHADAGVFIRSMATRGALGGLAKTTTEMALLLDAAGREEILVETVGVGQDEVEIARLADVTIVVLVPGMGDDVQAIKAGIMEIADVFVINKSDQPGADRLEREIRAVQSLAARPDGWVPPLVRTVATEGQGIDLALAAARRYLEFSRGKRGQANIWAQRLREMLRERLLERFRHLDFAAAGERVASREIDPYALLDSWLGLDFAIDHLGVAVESIDDSLQFYAAQLGLPVAGREHVATEEVNVAMLPAGDSRIELLEAAEPDSVIAKFIAKRGAGLHHVALRVPDLQAAVERLRAAGARLLNEPRAGAGGRLYVFVHPSSTGGVLLELIQG